MNGRVQVFQLSLVWISLNSQLASRCVRRGGGTPSRDTCTERMRNRAAATQSNTEPHRQGNATMPIVFVPYNWTSVYVLFTRLYCKVNCSFTILNTSLAKASQSRSHRVIFICVRYFPVARVFKLRLMRFSKESKNRPTMPRTNDTVCIAMLSYLLLCCQYIRKVPFQKIVVHRSTKSHTCSFPWITWSRRQRRRHLQVEQTCAGIEHGRCICIHNCPKIV